MSTEYQDLRLRDARIRLRELSPKVLSASELIGVVLGTGAIADAMTVSEQLLATHEGLLGIARLRLIELESQWGIGPAKAAQLQATLELGRRLTLESFGNRPMIRKAADVAALCMPEMSLLQQEVFRAFLLDTRNQLIATKDIYTGTANSINMRTCEVFREAIRHGCTSLIVVHNHPSGDASPSQEDVLSTQALIKAGDVLDIEVLDHLIIGCNTYVSLKERGLGFYASITPDAARTI